MLCQLSYKGTNRHCTMLRKHINFIKFSQLSGLEFGENSAFFEAKTLGEAIFTPPASPVHALCGHFCLFLAYYGRRPCMAGTVTFEKVWFALQETNRIMNETYRQIRESGQEIDRKMRQTDRRIGELGNRFGELAEHLVWPQTFDRLFLNCQVNTLLIHIFIFHFLLLIFFSTIYPLNFFYHLLQA